MNRYLLVFALGATLGACTWVKLDEGGAVVRVVYDGRVGACRSLGEVEVSVKASVGAYQRNEIKVRDELESLARNEAAGMHGDTIRALDEPQDGRQRFAVYACGRNAARGEDRRETPRREGEAETYPVR